MNKFFYYFYLISLILLVYLFGFLTFKYDLYPKAWLNGSINLFIKDLDESKRNFLLNSLKIISENKNSNEFQYSVKKNSNLYSSQFQYNINNQFSGYMLLSFEDDKLGSLNFGLYKNPLKKVYSWSFKNTIKPKVMLHVFPNGNALIYNDEFISLISSDSKEIWKLKKVVHHWGSVKENKLYIPGRKYVNYPEDLDISSKKLNIGKCKVKNALADTILEIDIKKGAIIREIDLLPIISSHYDLSKKLGYSKKIFSKLKNEKNDNYFTSLFLGPSYCDDLTHLNDIKILQKKNLKYFRNNKIGDFLLSLHTMDTLVAVDHEDLKIKWYLRKEFKRQHSPNMTNDGMILIFDNKGGYKKYGKSRILKYDINNENFDSYFDGNENFFFESLIRGRIQIFNNQIFVTSSQQGEVFRLDCLGKKLNKCRPVLIFSLHNENKPIPIFVADFYSENYFSKDFLNKIN